MGGENLGGPSPPENMVLGNPPHLPFRGTVSPYPTFYGKAGENHRLKLLKFVPDRKGVCDRSQEGISFPPKKIKPEMVGPRKTLVDSSKNRIPCLT